MTCMILDGKVVSIAAEATFKQRALVLEKLSGGKKPILATILVGADPASATYVRMKGEACKRVGIEPLKIELAESTTTSELMSKIKELNDNKNVHGILLQHPVPGQLTRGFASIPLRRAKTLMELLLMALAVWR